MDAETKEAKNLLSTIQSCLQETQEIARSKDNDEAVHQAECIETDIYELAECFGLGPTDF